MLARMLPKLVIPNQEYLYPGDHFWSYQGVHGKIALKGG